MPPIPVHIDAPITPQKHQQPSTSPPVAQPGAAPVPAPTGTSYTPNHYQPQPSRTTAALNDAGPPTPQPGAVPLPLPQQVPVTDLPPPPKAGEAAALREQEQPVTTQPPQMYMSSPAQNYAPTHTTSTTDTLAKAGPRPTTLNFGAVSPVGGGIAAPSNPPGYQQNVMAQEMSAAARASLDANERCESLAGGFGLGGSGTNTLPGVGGTNGSIWDTVKDWGTTVGTTLAETEKKVWERVNKS